MNQPKLLWSYWHSIARSCSSSSPKDIWQHQECVGDRKL